MPLNSAAVDRAPKHALLIDDNPDDRALVRRELQRAFGKVETTHVVDADIFEAALSRGDFDLVITDYELRWSNGLKIVKAIRERFPNRPIVMYTGTGNEEVAVAAIQAGLDEYVVKSPAKVALVPVAAMAAVQKAIERRRMREHEERTRTILDTVTDGIVTIDEAGLIQSFNPGAAAIFGYAADELVGENVKVLMPEPERSAHDGYIRNYLATGKAKVIGIGREVRGRTKDGRVFPMDLTVSEMRTETGDRQFIGSIRDLTLRKSIEEQLHRAQKMEAIGQMTGGIAHDFNNLLTVILDNLEMANDRVGDDHQLRQTIGLAMSAAERGAALTRRLLAFSRRQVLQPQVLALNALVVNVSDMVRRTLGESIEIRNKTEDRLWPVLVDKDQVESAMLNLAINSRDAMPRGGTLTIETANVRLNAGDAELSPESAPGDYVRLSVIDMGTGMTPEVMSRAFEPFFTTKEAGKGTGLGLSMVYGFVRQSSGFVRIESEVVKGTTVSIYLPRCAQGQPSALAEPRDEPGIAASDATILVVEDDDLVRGTVIAQIERLGYRVIPARNGPDALRILGQTRDIDLMLTDIVMPGGINGRELARDALALNPALRVLFTSGYEDTRNPPETVGETIEILRKPFKKDDLARIIREALNKGAN